MSEEAAKTQGVVQSRHMLAETGNKPRKISVRITGLLRTEI
jgi:hypothetical protein